MALIAPGDFLGCRLQHRQRHGRLETGRFVPGQCPADTGTITDGEGADLIYGGAVGDTIYGDLSNPALDGINIEDATDLAPQNGRDTIYGGDGNDLILGQDDADSLFGGAESDSLAGGDGRDLLDGRAGVDTLTGGAGDNRSVADGTADTITDFDLTTGAGDADPFNDDSVDISAFYNAATLAAWNANNPGNTFNGRLDWLRTDQADGILQAAGACISRTAGWPGPGLTTENTSVICFAPGTRISTAWSSRMVP